MPVNYIDWYKKLITDTVHIIG